MDKPGAMNLFTVCSLATYGIMLSMIGPGLSFASYMVHWGLSALPGGLLAGAILNIWDTFWNMYFEIEVEKVLRNG